MSAACQSNCGSSNPSNDPRWRRVLWVALSLNAVMFVVEGIAGVVAGSRALQADALDFFGDAANYAISLGVAGMALQWRARAALAKGVTILIFGLCVLGWAIWGLLLGSNPQPYAMSTVGTLALAVNMGVAVMLYRFRTGDANMQSVWICSRNDAINNLLVIGAGLAVFLTDSGWPDLLVALVMATLGIVGGWQIIRQARSELQHGDARRVETAWLERRLAVDLLIRDEQATFHTARSCGDDAAAWEALKAVHILAQPYIGPHWSSHVAMLRYAIVQRDWREVGGQVVRLMLVPLGNATGRLPVGNHGRSRVSPFQPMPVPEGVRRKLAEANGRLLSQASRDSD